ncbi:hypothetical protein [Pseudomonas sp. FP198]|uniref:hypothetical protein n=1 Tax=Pseudomonas sp. FP198 TaxID=2954084 RepID=UPI0027351349|nr:hypothetical protein [Pseudomonas sp. FP198]WLG97612.1 hypothetical protein PSH78_09630 [Pseudomonas sp. FP198]
MSTERISQLEQALLAVIAAAGKMGVSCDELCAQAVGGLVSERYWGWADAQHAQGAADEIDNALAVLVGRQTATPGNPVQSGPDAAFESAAG